MSSAHSRLNWRKKNQYLPVHANARLRDWLFDMGSLTQRLIRHCDGRFSVKILSISRAVPSSDEIKALGMKPRGLAIIRQVVLYCDQTPLVYARTIIPVSSLRGALRGLVKLGNRPLGAVLFADRAMHRSLPEAALLKADHQLYSNIKGITQDPVWGRRSVFILKGERLLVSEFFLPTLIK